MDIYQTVGDWIVLLFRLRLDDLFDNFKRPIDMDNLIDVPVDNAVLEDLNRSIHDHVFSHFFLDWNFHDLLDGDVFYILVELILFVWVLPESILGANFFCWASVCKGFADLLAYVVDFIEV